MTAKLVEEGKALESAIVDEKALSILSEERLRILKALCREPKYPAELARELKMQVQTLYYHIRLLSEAKLVEIAEYEERKGGSLAKRYGCPAGAISVVLSEKWKPFSERSAKAVPAFLKPFISNGYLDAKIIVGSPDPHGKFRARGSELCGMELAMLLGSHASYSHPLYYLDTETQEKTKKNSNLILIGGPKVNMVTDEINSHLPIRFEEKGFGIHSTLSNKKYTENFGIIEVIESPFNMSKRILLIAGSNHSATRAAVLALNREMEKISKGNMFDGKKIAKVVQGFDEDGDGIVDAVEILE